MGIKKGTKHNIGITVREVDAWLRKARPGAEKRVAKGLSLRCSAGGTFWSFRATSPVTGHQRRYDLWADDPAGEKSYPEASLAEACARAARLRELIGAGIDPELQAQQARERAAEEQRLAAEVERAVALERERRVTVRQLFERWAATQLAPRPRTDGSRQGRKDGGQYVREMFERWLFPKWGDVPAAELTKADWLGPLDAAKGEGKLRTANMLLAEEKQMLNFAVDRALVPSNPLALVKKRSIGGADTARERVLSEEEIGELATALPAAKLGERTECAIWLTLATGVRIGELTGPVWAEDLPAAAKARQVRLAQLQAICEPLDIKLGVVDLAARTWYLPTTKNGRDHRIHLSDFALTQLRRLHALREPLHAPDDLGREGAANANSAYSPWVFPGRDNRLPLNVKSIGKQLADRQRPAAKRLAGRTTATSSLALPGGRWTAHDLRRTSASMMARLGFATDVVNEALNHITTDRMARVYIRDRREADQRRAFDTLGLRLAQVLSGLTPAKVLPLRAA